MPIDEKTLAELVWLEPWQLLETPAGLPLERALSRELAAEHVLFGRSAHAIARRSDCDDVLFALESPAELAVVHLTYARSRGSEFPHSMVFQTLEEFVEGCMQPDHAEYTDEDDDDEE